MEEFVGKILTIAYRIMPITVMRVRVKIAGDIISNYSKDSYEQFQTVQRFNRFLSTMEVNNRRYVMDMCDIKPAPSWSRSIHTGE